MAARAPACTADNDAPRGEGVSCGRRRGGRACRTAVASHPSLSARMYLRSGHSRSPGWTTYKRCCAPLLRAPRLGSGLGHGEERPKAGRSSLYLTSRLELPRPPPPPVSGCTAQGRAPTVAAPMAAASRLALGPDEPSRAHYSPIVPPQSPACCRIRSPWSRASSTRRPRYRDQRLLDAANTAE